MFRKPKRVTPAELAGELAAAVLDPEACRQAASRVPGRPDPDPVGCCEAAFAGFATLKHVVDETLSPAAAAQMNSAFDAALRKAFEGGHTAETEAHYGAEPLCEVAAEAVGGYLAPAYFSRRLAETMISRLEVEGAPAASIASLAQVFSDITARSALAISRSGLS